MSPALEPSASRGEITLQPSYFTSSLYIYPLHQDVTDLIDLYSKRYDESTGPFELFKTLWKEQGWCWLHMRVHDGRARQSFVSTTERVFIETLAERNNPMEQAVALFGLYTFHSTQPSTSAPPTQYFAPRISIPIDLYRKILSLPSRLNEPRLLRMRRYVVQVLTSLLDVQVFDILPVSSLHAQNPAKLPREIFVPEGQDFSAEDHQAGSGAPSKKKGRPSKRDKIRKTKEALASLEKFVDKNIVINSMRPPASPEQSDSTPPGVTHVVFGQAPHASLSTYEARKDDLLAAVYADASGTPASTGPPLSGQTALLRANEAVLLRLKQIDAMAAEQGLEVGGEGGEQTGLERVERAVDELRRSSGLGACGGILGLLEGAGIDQSN